MDTKEALDRWARDAVTMALYECFLATASIRENEAEQARGEAEWLGPAPADWLEWMSRRRLVDDVKRAK